MLWGIDKKLEAKCDMSHLSSHYIIEVNQI